MTSRKTIKMIEDRLCGHDKAGDEINLPVLESFPRVAQILQGIVPNVRTVGIIVAANPIGSALSPAENKERNAKLEGHLRDLLFMVHRAVSSCSNFENPCIVLNFKKELLFEFGKKYGQRSVIYGHAPYAVGDHRLGMTFELWKRNSENKDYEKIATRKIYTTVAKGTKDLCTQWEGKRFTIPYFDEKEEDSTLLGGTVLRKDKIPVTPFTESLVKEINVKIEQNLVWPEGYCRYANRGMARQRIKELRLISEGELPADKPSVSRAGCFPPDYDPVKAEAARLLAESQNKITIRKDNKQRK